MLQQPRQYYMCVCQYLMLVLHSSLVLTMIVFVLLSQNQYHQNLLLRQKNNFRYHMLPNQLGFLYRLGQAILGKFYEFELLHRAYRTGGWQ